MLERRPQQQQQDSPCGLCALNCGSLPSLVLCKCCALISIPWSGAGRVGCPLGAIASGTNIHNIAILIPEIEYRPEGTYIGSDRSREAASETRRRHRIMFLCMKHDGDSPFPFRSTANSRAAGQYPSSLTRPTRCPSLKSQNL